MLGIIAHFRQYVIKDGNKYILPNDNRTMQRQLGSVGLCLDSKLVSTSRPVRKRLKIKLGTNYLKLVVSSCWSSKQACLQGSGCYALSSSLIGKHKSNSDVRKMLRYLMRKHQPSRWGDCSLLIDLGTHQNLILPSAQYLLQIPF